MRLSELDYELPKKLIAQRPLPKRDHARLLVYQREEKKISHHIFFEIERFLRKGDILVLNDTKVLHARLDSRRTTGARIGILLLKRMEKTCWEVLLSSSRKLSCGEILSCGKGLSCQLKDRLEGKRWLVEFSTDPLPLLGKIGQVPLPPYIKRKEGVLEEDKIYYQSVYARHEGSIAAPTAGLHFTKELLEKLSRKGVKVVYLTLHIGIGSFRMISSEETTSHRMDAEYYIIPQDVAGLLEESRASPGRIIACGTSTARALESFARSGKTQQETTLFIHPPFIFKMVGGLITNFHLPRSTPLLIVFSLIGREETLRIYQEAIRLGYRFYSYGDAMLII
jgi:S-adenosylmethionine:tRNA ribosyltransferase-isomerase